VYSFEERFRFAARHANRGKAHRSAEKAALLRHRRNDLRCDLDPGSIPRRKIRLPRLVEQGGPALPDPRICNLSCKCDRSEALVPSRKKPPTENHGRNNRINKLGR